MPSRSPSLPRPMAPDVSLHALQILLILLAVWLKPQHPTYGLAMGVREQAAATVPRTIQQQAHTAKRRALDGILQVRAQLRAIVPVQAWYGSCARTTTCQACSKFCFGVVWPSPAGRTASASRTSSGLERHGPVGLIAADAGSQHQVAPHLSLIQCPRQGGSDGRVESRADVGADAREACLADTSIHSEPSRHIYLANGMSSSAYCAWQV